MAPADLLLRPGHEVWHGWHYCIYLHHPSVPTQPVSWLCHKNHTGLMKLPKLVSALPCWVLIAVVDIIHFWLWRWRQLLLLRRWLRPRLLLDHRPRLRREHLSVCTRQLPRRRSKFLLLNWLHRPKTITFSSSANPTALPSRVPRWGCSWPSVKCTQLIQHCLIIPA